MKASELIKLLTESIECCGDGDVYVVDHPSEVGSMDAGCPIAMVRNGEDGVYLSMSNWG